MARHPWDGGDPQQPLENLAAKHRLIARLLIQGASQTEIAKMVDMTNGRVSIIVNSPAFKEHLSLLEAEADERAVDVSRRISQGTKKGLDILLNVLNPGEPEHGEATVGQRIQVAQDFMDRQRETSKVSRSQNETVVTHVTVEDIRELKAAKRSIKDITPSPSAGQRSPSEASS